MYKSIIILLLSGSSVCLSQESYGLPLVNGKPFALFMEESFRNIGGKQLDTLGIQGVCWVKLHIGTDKSITHIATNPGTHAVLASFLKETLQQTNGLWQPTTNGEELILPVRYVLQGKAKPVSVVIDPTALDYFFSEKGDASMQYIFLPAQEYTSPFDGYKTFKTKLVNN